ncbi:DNA transposase THAP9 [Discoglossus pictus]
MPVSCAASGCKSRYTLQAREKGITFHRFPRSNPVLLEKWRMAMKRGELWMPSRYQRLCSLHFQEGCFDTTGQTKRLRGDVIPSIFHVSNNLQSEVSEEPPQVTPELAATSDPVIPEPAENPEPAVEMLKVKKDECFTSPVQLQDHLYFIPDVETLKRKLLASEDSRAQKEKELRNAKDREKRLRQTCPSIYQELSKKNLMTPELTQRLQPYGDIPLELFKKLESEYSAQQRMFALTLQLYDASAYRYLRNEMQLPLPGARKLRQWLKTDCDKPGINTLVLEALLYKMQEQPLLYTRACLALDTISLQQQIHFDSQQNELIGFVNLGKDADSSGSQQMASEVLVMTLVGTAGHWKAPIAYFFVNDLTADAQKQLVMHVLYELCDHGFEIVAITMERSQRNKDMCSLLGCKFSDPQQLQTHFCLPDSENKHYVLFDVVNEQRIISELLEECGTIHSPDGNIMWQYINDLMNLHKTTAIQMPRNQTFASRDVFSHLMRAPLMVNPLSNTAAKCLTMLQELNCERFSGSTATISFIQIMDQLIDILTSKSRRANCHKGAVNVLNLQQKLSVLQETKEYLLALTVCDNSPLYQSPRGSAILGLLVNITSLVSLLPNLLLAQDHVTTHIFGPDHLNQVLNGIRKAGKLIKKPTAADVQDSISRQLSQCGLLNTDLPSHPLETNIHFLTTEEDCAPCIFKQQLQPVFQELSIALPDHFYSSPLLGQTFHNSEMYMAGWVVRKAYEHLSCNKCRWALVMEDMPQDFRNAYHLLQIKTGGTFLPSEGVVKTVLTAEKELYHMITNDTYKHNSFPLKLEHCVLSRLGTKDIFNLKDHITSTECGIDNHHFQLLRLVTSLYYGLRQAYVTRLTKRRQYQEYVKQILTKPTDCIP